MPVIACPGCGKKYNLPESAAGQVATCKCGKRFKVGGGAPKAPSAPAAAVNKTATATAPTKATSKAAPVAVAKSAPRVKAAGVAKAAPAASAAAIVADDDFWDEGLKTVTVAKEPEPKPASLPKPSTNPVDHATKKKRPKEKKVKWGFDWGRVAGGGISFLLFGGLTMFLLLTTGRIFIWFAVAAIGGLLTALSGLMGEEGIW
jgi:hypothetical protein